MVGFRFLVAFAFFVKTAKTHPSPRHCCTASMEDRFFDTQDHSCLWCRLLEGVKDGSPGRSHSGSSHDAPGGPSLPRLNQVAALLLAISPSPSALSIFRIRVEQSYTLCCWYFILGENTGGRREFFIALNSTGFIFHSRERSQQRFWTASRTYSLACPQAGRAGSHKLLETRNSRRARGEDHWGRESL